MKSIIDFIHSVLVFAFIILMIILAMNLVGVIDTWNAPLNTGNIVILSLILTILRSANKLSNKKNHELKDYIN